MYVLFAKAFQDHFNFAILMLIFATIVLKVVVVKWPQAKKH